MQLSHYFVSIQTIWTREQHCVDEMNMNHAKFSECMRYRYELSRVWSMDPRRFCMFVMLNPSTADAQINDATIRRCIGYAKEWGYDGLYVGNVYAYRSTDPRQLWTVDDPVGPENDASLKAMAHKADLVVAAWGTNAKPERVGIVLNALRYSADVHFLELTKAKQPKHPLYLKSELTPQLLATAHS
jgi:hypothetical protein